jgi:sugar phosphate isomerase/epimerase
MKFLSIAILAIITLVSSMQASGIKLALQTFTFRDRSFVETVETAKRLGIQYLEPWPGQRLGGEFEGRIDFRTISQETLAKLKDYLEAEGVRIVGYGVIVRQAETEAEWRKLMEFAQFLGIEYIQTEVGNPERLDIAEKMANEFGIKVALHNHRQAAGLPEAKLAELKRRGPYVGAGSDTGHWMTAGVRPLDGVRLLSGRFVTMHLVDGGVIVNDRVRPVPFGSGVGEIDAVLDELRAQGFNGFVTLEHEHMSPSLESEVATSVRWFNAYQAGLLDAGEQVTADSIDVLHAGFSKSGQYLTWDMDALAGEVVGDVLETRLADLQMLEIVPETVQGNSPGYGNGKEGPPMAFGTDSSRKYCQVWEGNAFVSGALSEPAVAVFYTISSANGPVNRAPKDWVLYGSTDGVSWQELDRRSDEAFGGRFVLKGFEIKQPQAFQHYKLEILSHHGNKDMEFGRFALFSAK